MTISFRSSAAAALVLTTLALAPRTAHAQLTVVGGVSQYDLSGTGNAPFAAVRLSVPLVVAVVEGSLGALRTTDGGDQRTYIVPEAQLQWQMFPLLVKPYVGVGGGVFREISGPGSHTSEFTASASAGVRVAVPVIGAGFQAELRVRGIGTGFKGSAAEWTVGLSW